jgi:pimeloyl-ACP methyl ester carboxylesterase
VAHYHPAPNPPIDCFYLYPNITGQQTPNATRKVTKPEVAIAELEAAPFSRVCRVFAPVYRSSTGHSSGTVSSQAAFQVAYASAKVGWEAYLAKDNHGRGVVLIGHSEGASILQRLLAEVIDPDASERRLLVSAILPGTDIPVPQGVPWGPFVHTPACSSPSQSGCVITYNAYSVPPATDSTFGRTRTTRAGSVTFAGAYCTNPAALGGGSGLLTSLYRTRLPVPVPGSVADGIFGNHPPRAEAGTSWVQLVDEYSARCAVVNGADVLEVTALPGAPRLAATPGSTLATFGLHVDDPNLALGNLVDLVRMQTLAYTAVHAQG